MIDVVINYDESTGSFKLYEPTTDTLLITTSLGDTFIKLSEFLRQSGMIAEDILSSSEITYHIDSATFLALIQSNVSLLKRLNTAPSGFMISSKRFGVSGQGGNNNNSSSSTKKKGKRFGSGGSFSKSSFVSSYKKFGDSNK